jgi:integrase
MPIINLSDVTPDKMICPPELRRVELVDVGGLGLYCELRRSSPGVGTFYLRYKNADGKTCHQKIGSTAVLTVAEARREAKRIKAEITLGADPRAEAKARRAVPTYATFFEDHYLKHVEQFKRSWDRDEELYRLRIKAAFGHRRLDQITRHQIQLFLAALTEEGLAPATVRLHLVVIRYSLNLAREWGMLEGDNPASRIPLPPLDNKVEHLLDDAQLKRLLEVLRSDANRPVCRVCLFLLSTGCRLNEALSATWSDIDLERRVFSIRATNTKSGRRRSVPLNDSAMAVLGELEMREKGGRLFVGRRGALSTVAKQWDRLRKKAGLPHLRLHDLRLHDLRHQFASFLVNDGRTLYEVQAILGHSSSKVTERYAHLSTRTLQEAAASAATKLNGATPKSAA